MNSLKENTNIVYRIYNKINNKSYIGKSSKCFNQRYSGGRWWIKTHNEELRSDAISYGILNFEVEILKYNLSLEEMAQFEENYITHYNALSPNGYNHIADVKRNIWSESTRQKISQSVKTFKRTNPDSRKGTKLSPEVCARMKAGRVGIHLSEQHRQNLSISNKGKHSAAKGPMSPEHREKIKQGHLRGGMSSECRQRIAKEHMGKNHHASRAVAQLDMFTGVILQTFDSITDACRKTGANETGIGSACKGRLKTSKKFGWKYI